MAARRRAAAPPLRSQVNSWGAPRWDWEAANEAAPLSTGGARHPLADAASSAALRRRALTIEAAFDAIAPALESLAPQQFEAGFAARAAQALRAQLQLDFPEPAFAASWVRPLDLGALHAQCVVATFCRLLRQGFDRSLSDTTDEGDAGALIRRWGFHAVDITACADGRLSGVTDYILRVPPAIVAYRDAHAGAMFGAAETLRNWERIELSRWRRARPNAAGEATRYLKIGVYHFSSADPHHAGCAAHGSNDAAASGALLERLEQGAQAIRQVHGTDAAVATLLVGVDTDTDSIRVHVPDAAGRMDTRRFVDSNMLYDETQFIAREAGKEAIRHAVAHCTGVAADDRATEGMRWLCGYLLKNNFGQIEAVRTVFGGRYVEAGHTEKLIVVGDAFDDLQLRNLAFQAHMATVEEGAAELDTGIRILHHHHAPRALPVPVLVHKDFDARIPDAAAVAESEARRLALAVRARHEGLVVRGQLHIAAVIREAGGRDMSPVALPELEVQP
jgi:carboxysome shell carbonic anhydrase